MEVKWLETCEDPHRQIMDKIYRCWSSLNTLSSRSAFLCALAFTISQLQTFAVRWIIGVWNCGRSEKFSDVLSDALLLPSLGSVVTTFEWAFQFNFISFFSYALHRCAREWDFMQFYCVRYNVEFALIGVRWVMQHNFNLKLTKCPARAHRCDLLMSSLTSSLASNFHFMRATLAQPQPDSQPIYIYFKFTFLFLINFKLIGRKSSTLQHSHSVPTVQKLLFKRFHRPKELKRLVGSISCGKLCKMLRLIVQWLTLTLLTLLHISSLWNGCGRNKGFVVSSETGTLKLSRWYLPRRLRYAPKGISSLLL